MMIGPCSFRPGREVRVPDGVVFHRHPSGAWHLIQPSTLAFITSLLVLNSMADSREPRMQARYHDAMSMAATPAREAPDIFDLLLIYHISLIGYPESLPTRQPPSFMSVPVSITGKMLGALPASGSTLPSSVSLSLYDLGGRKGLLFEGAEAPTSGGEDISVWGLRPQLLKSVQRTDR